MDIDIYNEVHQIVCDLVNASAIDDTKAYWKLYHALEVICESNDSTKRDHPFQWETLADFTTDDSASLSLYGKAFNLAKALSLNEYMASIQLALAERYVELGMHDKAYLCANAANEYAVKTEDLDLRKSISEFLLSGNDDT
ncbi:MAG: tetratricopeptide repeat protein [Oleispira sp.]|nr:tetratricopeptide repeat protein [Oleispira sp.]MBL4882565.1 tetratricopeptide repeat protein [Oleispira sp.]